MTSGFATILGVSNVSHGLPSRPLLNAAFFEAAVAAGLDAALAQPQRPRGDGGGSHREQRACGRR